MALSNPAPNERSPTPPSSDTIQPQMTVHALTLPTATTMHMYPFPSRSARSQPQRAKRRQVKNACTHCQKACKKCDDARPCLRCVKYGNQGCIDSPRKERKKGVKRGPYKKRDGRASRACSPAAEEMDLPQPLPYPILPIGTSTVNPPAPCVGPIGYAAGFFAGPVPAPGEPQIYYQAVYFAPAPPHMHGIPQQAEQGGYLGQPPQHYPPTFSPAYPQGYPPAYMVPHRGDGQMMLPANAHSAAYPPPPPPSQFFQRPISQGNTDTAPHPIGKGRQTQGPRKRRGAQ